jgi:HSP20 family molecular chaperone IbpA
MSTVAVQKVKKPETAPTLLESLDKLFEDVRMRAFDLFQRRGALDGGDLDDWFRAEHDLVWAPESELVETDKEFQMTMAVPAMEAKDVQVSALPDAIIVQGETSHMEEKKEGKVHFSEFNEKKLFRRFTMPAEVDVEQVKATLENGMLRITAAKAAVVPKKTVSVAAGA